MIGLYQAPAALSPGKQPPVPIRREDEWAPETVTTLKRHEYFLAAVAIPTELYRPYSLFCALKELATAQRLTINFLI
jgi:hypothetical protein